MYLYFAQAYHYQFYNKPLFLDEIEAGNLGSLILEISKKYWMYTSLRIKDDVKVDLYDGNVTDEQLTVIKIFLKLHGITTWRLMEMCMSSESFLKAYREGGYIDLSNEKLFRWI